MAQENINIIRINLKKEIDESYDILFGSNLFEEISKDCESKRCAIITDSNILNLFGYDLKKELEKKGIFVNIFSFKAGEESKNIYTCVDLMDQMFKKGYGRDSVILALGGGVVGDMAGFIASLFNRGITYIQIPTSLLAQVDSSIGGKTGVDSKYGKNLIGTFKQPDKVYVDIGLLKNIPERELKAGLSEIVKYGIIYNKSLFEYIEQNLDKIMAKDENALLHIVKESCRIKGEVVERDKFETGERRILNYGHTIGHAIEILSNFSLNHGESISIGMTVSARISLLLGFLSEDNFSRQKELLEKIGLPTKVPLEMSNEDIINITKIDKKAKGGKARHVLPCEIGQMCDFDSHYATFVEDFVVNKAIDESR